MFAERGSTFDFDEAAPVNFEETTPVKDKPLFMLALAATDYLNE